MNKKSNPAWILVGALIVFVPLIIMALQGGWSPKMLPATPAQAQSYIPTVVDGTYNVRVAPTISEARAEQVLCTGHPGMFDSQTCQQFADDLYSLGVQYTIDPSFALAVFKHESNFGETGEARLSKSIGNVECIKRAGWNAGITFWCTRNFTDTSTWHDGAVLYYRLLNGSLYQGKNTVQEIIKTASPPPDNNTPAYVAAVEHDMQTWAN